MRFIDDDERCAPLLLCSPAAEHLDRDKANGLTRAARRGHPRIAERRRCDHENVASVDSGRQSYEGLAETYVIGKEGAAVLLEQTLHAIDAQALVRVQLDLPQSNRLLLSSTKDVCGDSRAHLVRGRDSHGLDVKREATSLRSSR